MGNAKPYLASIESRLLAQTVDLGIILLGTLLILGVFEFVGRFQAYFSLSIPFLYVMYHTTALVKPNYGVGRVIAAITVISSNGSVLTLSQAFIRSFSRIGIFILGFLSSYVIQHPFMLILPCLVEIAVMMCTPQRQSLADIFAHTLVIKTPQVQPHRAPAGPMYSTSDAEFGLLPKWFK